MSISFIEILPKLRVIINECTDLFFIPDIREMIAEYAVDDTDSSIVTFLPSCKIPAKHDTTQLDTRIHMKDIMGDEFMFRVIGVFRYTKTVYYMSGIGDSVTSLIVDIEKQINKKTGVDIKTKMIYPVSMINCLMFNDIDCDIPIYDMFIDAVFALDNLVYTYKKVWTYQLRLVSYTCPRML
jgi:hypothetical protein